MHRFHTRSPTRIMTLALLAALALACGSDPTGSGDDGPPPVQDGHPFTYDPPAAAPTVSTISVRGAFNSWGETTMSRQDDGSWRVLIELADGTHPYKFFINGGWVDDMCYDETWGHPDQGFIVDPDASGCVSDGYEGQNAVITLGEVALNFRHSPTDPVHVSAADGHISVRFLARASRVESATAIAGADTVPFHPQLAIGLDMMWRATLPETATGYDIEVVTPDSTAAFGPYSVPGDLFTAVPWAGGAVAYQIFPERFWNGDPSNDSLALATDEVHYRDPATGLTQPTLSAWDGPVLDTHCCHQYFGGDLQGIMDRLDHVEALGADVVYLNPIFVAGSAHGYDTFDYNRVAPSFGDSAVLRALVDDAHARGIRMIWDFVPNHVGIGHWAFQDAVTNGEASPYWSWFRFHVPVDSIQVGNGNHYDGWWGLGSLPELQTEVPAVLDHLMAVAQGWTQFGFDGIRVDVPGDIDNRVEFFHALRQTAKAADPDVYLLGEIWERDPSWLRGDQFDALMNYAVGQGIVAAFARGEIAGPVAARQLAATYAAYPEAATVMLFNLIASHDTARLLTMMGGGDLGGSPGPSALARHRLATAFLYALPGMPVTFQGDECAFLGRSDGNHTARYPMQWTRCDAAMTDHYTALADLKHGLPGLASAAFRRHPDTPAPLLAFHRGEPGPGEVLVVLNNTSATAAMDLPTGTWTDAETGAPATGSIDVPAMGWRFLERS